MSDPRFARLKTDPRFRKPKKHQSKVVVDERFKSVFVRDKKHGRPKHAPRVDKFGRRLADDHDKDNLRRFYRLENQDAEESTNGPDYARGEVLFESSDEDEDGPAPLDDEDSDVDHVVTLGGEDTRRQSAHGEHEDFEVDLDESSFADLDAQAAAYFKAAEEEEEDAVDDNTIRTRRLAAVNLDWDHVRASHLFKIFDSILPSSSGTSSYKGVAAPIIRGKVLSVRVYPSRFGKDRMEREEREGPPAELFRRKRDIDEEEIDEKNIYETGDADEYDDDALRKYQLERLRYYYAVIECDNVQVASHIYSELQGTELERSANVFDLTFIPDDMVFDDDFRDEATAVGLDIPYKALDFATDALRHSKVKLTWDQEDPERSRVTRRALTKKEAEEGDFHVYIASSSGSESEPAAKRTQGIDREKMRALLLGGSQSDLPEGWGNTKSGGGDEADDVDMEVTFMPALSSKPQEEETTLDKYQRKMREKRKKRKEEWKAKAGDSEGISETRPKTMKDDFFGESDEEENKSNDSTAKGSASDGRHKSKDQRRPSTEGELTLLTTADGSDDQAKHFDMKAVLKAEKGKKSRKTKWTKKNHSNDEANELQEDFTIDVKDERFRALHDDHRFAIDPSNPQFKKTKSMSALLDERSKRQQRKRGDHLSEQSGNAESGSAGNLQSLVESVKRKSISHQRGTGKRRRT